LVACSSINTYFLALSTECYANKLPKGKLSFHLQIWSIVGINTLSISCFVGLSDSATQRICSVLY